LCLNLADEKRGNQKIKKSTPAEIAAGNAEERFVKSNPPLTQKSGEGKRASDA